MQRAVRTSWLATVLVVAALASVEPLRAEPAHGPLQTEPAHGLTSDPRTPHRTEAIDSPVSGEVSAAARAQDLFKRGREALGRGDRELACDQFEASNNVLVAAGTLINLALCEEELGRLVRALSHFEAFLGRVQPDDDRRPIAEAHVSALRRRLPRLIVRVDGDVTANAQVLLDGQTVSPDRLGAEILVDPGEHHLSLMIEGDTAERHVVRLGEAALEQLTLRSKAIRSDPPRTLPSAPPALAPPASAREPSDTTLVWIFGAVGAASLAASATTGALMLGRLNTVDEQCHEKLCSLEGLRAADAARDWALASDITLGAGLASAGLAAYFWLSGRKPSHPTALSLTLSSKHSGITWSCDL